MTELTPRQIEILVSAAATADGGCEYCAVGVIEHLETAFPDIRWFQLWAENEIAGCLRAAESNREKGDQKGAYYFEARAKHYGAKIEDWYAGKREPG